MKTMTRKLCFESVCAALCFIFLLLVLCSCTMFDLDGNGRIDPVAYLQNADISVSWVDAEGNAYTVDAMQLGEEIVYDYIQAKTGYRFEIVESGGIEVTDPNGYKVRIAPKE
jgi:hypothetical protein